MTEFPTIYVNTCYRALV